MANIVRWYPVGELAGVRGTVDRFFQRGLARPWRVATWENGTGFFPVDLYETGGLDTFFLIMPMVFGQYVAELRGAR